VLDAGLAREPEGQMAAASADVVLLERGEAEAAVAVCVGVVADPEVAQVGGMARSLTRCSSSGDSRLSFSS
jgi:hypothetical protein